jgi:hypothetical protein
MSLSVSRPLSCLYFLRNYRPDSNPSPPIMDLLKEKNEAADPDESTSAGFLSFLVLFLIGFVLFLGLVLSGHLSFLLPCLVILFVP